MTLPTTHMLEAEARGILKRYADLGAVEIALKHARIWSTPPFSRDNAALLAAASTAILLANPEPTAAVLNDIDALLTIAETLAGVA